MTEQDSRVNGETRWNFPRFLSCRGYFFPFFHSFLMDFEPFTVPSFSSKDLELLRDKLSKPIYPNELEQDVGWSYGAPTWAVKPLVEKWLNDFDWEVSRAEMNRWHHYHTTIDGLRIHLVHEPSSCPDAIPILLLHGWPSSFYEFHKIIEPLRDGLHGNQVNKRTDRTKAHLNNRIYISRLSMLLHQVCLASDFLNRQRRQVMAWQKRQPS